MTRSREVRLSARPTGLPTLANFSMETVDLPAPGPGEALVRNLYMSVVISDHFDLLPRFRSDMSGWIASGKIRWKETIDEDIEAAPEAFLKLFKGENFGKMLVKLH